MKRVLFHGPSKMTPPPLHPHQPRPPSGLVRHEERSFMTLSTGHVSAGTAKWMNCKVLDAAQYQVDPIARRPSNFDVAGNAYGWFMYVTDEPDMPMTNENYPRDLIDVLKFVKARGFDYVMFDCDCDAIPDLPIYDW